MSPYPSIKWPHQTNQTYYDLIVETVFCSGLNPSILKKYKNTLKQHFGDYLIVAKYTDDDLDRIYADEAMIHNMSKIKACVYNANGVIEICNRHNSMENYFLSFDGFCDPNLVPSIALDLRSRFKYFGEMNALHYAQSVIDLEKNESDQDA